MKNIYGERFTENTVVRLRKDVAKNKRRRPTARIAGWLEPDVPGGVVLSERLDGFLAWNINDLERVER